MISTMVAITTPVNITQFMTYGIIAITALIAILAFKEILNTKKLKNKKIQSLMEGLNIAMVPLAVVFAAILTYNVVKII